MRLRLSARLCVALVGTALIAAACGGGGSASAATWCDLASDVNQASDAIDTSSNPAEAFREMAKVVDGASKVAPDEIRDEVALMEQFTKDLVAALDANDDNIILAMDAVTADYDMDALDAASTKVEQYGEEVCGIPADSGSPDTGSSDTGSSDTGSSDTGSDSGLPEGGIIAGLARELGITEDQARCLVNEIDVNALMSGAEPDVPSMMGAFVTCDIDPTQLGGG